MLMIMLPGVMSSHRALLTGASGLLGRAIYAELKSHDDWSVLGLAFSRAQGELKKVDLTDSEQVENVITEFKVCDFG